VQRPARLALRARPIGGLGLGPGGLEAAHDDGIDRAIVALDALDELRGQLGRAERAPREVVRELARGSEGRARHVSSPPGRASGAGLASPPRAGYAGPRRHPRGAKLRQEGSPWQRHRS
jgi:hypothetical protein